MANKPYIYETMPFGPDRGFPINRILTRNLEKMLTCFPPSGELATRIKEELNKRLERRPEELEDNDGNGRNNG
jgi:hypothetical protein